MVALNTHLYSVKKTLVSVFDGNINHIITAVDCAHS